MAKIPIILEAGRADGKLIKTNSVYDDNQEKFLSDKIIELDNNHNNLKDNVNILTNIVNSNELDIETKLETEKTRATNAENNLRETINNITEVNENVTSANIVTVDTISNTSSSNVQQALNELFKNATYAGIATPDTNPNIPNSPIFYLANNAGVYTNFNNIEILNGELTILKWNNDTWTKSVIKPMTDFNSVFDANGKSLTDKLSELDKEVGEITLTSIDLNEGATQGNYINKSGSLKELASAIISKQIDLIKGEMITFFGKVANSMSAISLYENKTYIPKVLGAGYEQYKKYKYIAEDNCTVVLCSAYEHTEDFAIIGKSISDSINELENYTLLHDDYIKKLDDRVYGLEEIIQGGITTIDVVAENNWQNGRVLINSIQNVDSFVYIQFNALKGDKLKYYGSCDTSAQFLAYGTPRTNLVYGEGSGKYVEGEIEAPVDGVYWYCVFAGTKDVCTLIIERTLGSPFDKIEAEINEVKKVTVLQGENIKAVQENLKSLNDVVEDFETKDVALSSYIEGQYVYKDGTTKEISSARIYNNIKLSAGEKVSFYAKAHTIFAVISVVKNGAYTPKVLGVGYENYNLYEWIADKDCEVALTSAYDHSEEYATKSLVLSDTIKNLQSKVSEIVGIDEFGMNELDDNPLARLTEGGMAGIVRNWAFIGDSMASGATLGYEQGASSATEKDDYWASWGQFICRSHGSDGYNYSVGGESAKSWCVSEDNGRRWQKLQSQKHEAYIIALGQNDTYWVNSNDQNTQVRNYPCITAYPNRDSFKSEGLVITEDDVRADIDITDYNNNAGTFVGYYAGIIQRIKSVNELGYIFLMTNPQATAPNQPIYYKYYNDCIRHIYNIFKAIYPDTVWLIEMDKYSHYKDIKTQIALNGLHFGAFGYKWSALEINTYIDWIIRNNIKAFQGISMVLDNKKPVIW